jgi:hypothetical protein
VGWETGGLGLDMTAPLKDHDRVTRVAVSYRHPKFPWCLGLLALAFTACQGDAREVKDAGPEKPAATTAEPESVPVDSSEPRAGQAGATEHDTASTDATAEILAAKHEPLEPPPMPPKFVPPDESPPVVEGVEPKRADAPLSAKGRSANKMMPHDNWGKDVYALAGMAQIPAWAKSGTGDPELARDVDLATAWTCELDADGACAWALALPEPAELRVIRFLARPSRLQAEADGTVLTRVRVHTEAGFADIDLVEASGFHFLVLPESSPSRHVVVEFTKADGDRIHLSEIEVYGKSGQARTRLPVDPSRTWVVFNKRPWGGKGDVHGIRETGVIFDGETPRELARATALYGQPGDRYLLLERVWRSTCEEQEHAYTLVDTKTRRWLHVGRLAGMPAAVHRHVGGLGYALRGSEETWLVMEEKGQITRRRGARQLSAEFEPRAMMRGGGSVSDPPAGCTTATAEQLGVLPAEDRPKLTDSGMAISCAADDHHVIVQAARACGGRWTVHVLDADNKVTERLAARKDGARSPRIQRGSGGELYLELSPVRDGQSSVVTVTGEGILHMLTDTGALAIRRPVRCEGCDDAWIGPRAGL